MAVIWMLLAICYCTAANPSRSCGKTISERVELRKPGVSCQERPFTADSHALTCHTAVVVSDSGIASRVGCDVLRDGGGAVDAAVATAFALAVTHPAAGNIGGGGFLLFRSQDGEVAAYDFRESAPSAAHERMFLHSNIHYDPGLHHWSHRSVGVPGTVAGLHLAWLEHGRLPWRRLIEPAVNLASDGFVVSDGLAESLRDHWPKLSSRPAARALFSVDGVPFSAGAVLKQPDLARTLRMIARHGPHGFYQGRIAELIAKEMADHGGLITRSDMAAYRARKRDPLRGNYRGFDVFSMPPPTSGGAILVLMLNVLENHDLRKTGFGTPETIHLLAETMRRGFAVRARSLGDPDSNPGMPINQLLSKPYAKALYRTIQPARVSQSSADSFDWPPESPETTHLSVVDSERNAVALTYTLEESYGSGIVAPGTGFLLNNEMGDFNAAAGLTSTNGLIGTLPNLAGPHRRMLSSMTPAILTRDGVLFLVLGSPGGRTIINTVLQVILNVVDHDMRLPDAVAAPRFHHQWFPDEIVHEPAAFSSSTESLLRFYGHRVRQSKGPQGAVNAVRLHAGQDLLEGCADRRSPDSAAVGW